MSTRTTPKSASHFGISIALLSLLLLCTARNARADEIAVWNFNDSDLVVDHGSGALTTNFNLANILFTFGGTTTNARMGDSAGQSLTVQGGTSNGNNGRYITLSISTLGFSNIAISFATQGTTTGFNSNQLQYSLDGVTFFDFGMPYAPPTSFGLVSFDLSSILGLNNHSNAAIRIIFNGAATAGGNNRIDNLVVEGTPLAATVPEPASIFLLGLGLSLTGTLVRKRHRH